MKTRKEHDALGDVSVPLESYGGSFYSRAKQNFQISELKAPRSFRTALAWIKIAAARVNADLGHIEPELASVIEKAAQEFIAGKFDEDYDLDVYQAGAGTPFNMNLNEILANRANEILGESGKDGGKKGEYSPVHPNDHVNMAQSSNDVTPTAIRIAALIDLKEMMEYGYKLVKVFEAKAKEFERIVKVGRTHLQDAVPVTLGQEFFSYSTAIGRALERVEKAMAEVKYIGIGGTATGSGINTHPGFAEKICAELCDISELYLKPAENTFETTNSMAALLATSSAMRSLAVELIRISNDLRLMASGPKGGLGELLLPEVQPGSSIMPGKVNPSIPECLSMICIQVMGLDHSISLAAQQGQLELNWHTPLIMWDLLHQIEILGRGMKMFDQQCVAGLTANEKRMKEFLDSSTAIATALVPYMGYHEVAEIVQKSLDEKVPLISLVPEEFKKHLDPEAITRPNRK